MTSFLRYKQHFQKLSVIFTCLVSLLILQACGGSSSKNQGTTTNIDAETPYQKLEFVAGSLGGIGNADGPIGRFTYPVGIAVNTSGVIYVSDENGGPIRTISSTGIVSSMHSTSDNKNYTFNNSSPSVSEGILALDVAGNLYTAGRNSCQIQKITPEGITSVFAGQTDCGYLDGDKGVARFSSISSLAIDKFDNMYIVDQGNYVIRKINVAGNVSTLAGKAGVDGLLDGLDRSQRLMMASYRSKDGMVNGLGSNARFLWPINIAVDSAGVAYVSDGYYELRMISPAGEVTSFTGKDEDGRASFFGGLSSMVADNIGNLFVADMNKIKKITPAGVVSRHAGSDGNGRKDGQGIEARFIGYVVDGDQRMPGMLSIDKANNLFFADTFNHSIRKISPEGLVSTVAGRPDGYFYLEYSSTGSMDGSANVASFSGSINAMATDASGNLFINDDSQIRKITPKGDVSTLPKVVGVVYGDLVDSFAGVKSKDGTRYWIQYNSIYKTDPLKDGGVSLVAGHTRRSNHESAQVPHDGQGMGAYFGKPMALTLDSAGNTYVIDRSEHVGTIRKITPAGVVTTIAGSFAQHGYVDGLGSDTRFDTPNALAIDKDDNIFIADTYNHVIRKISKAGIVSTFAGTPMAAGSKDGEGLTASFNEPSHLVFDSYGNLYVADNGNYLIRKITPAGKVSTVAGKAGSRGTLPGALPANLSSIFGMTMDDKDTLYIFSEYSVLKLTK